MGANITLALLCSGCGRLFPGGRLLAANASSFELGTATILANTAIPNPLPATATSTTFPQANLAASQYVNITVDCWPPGFNSLVSLLSDSPCFPLI